MTLAVRILALGLLALAGAGTSEAKDVVIQAGTLFDGVSEAPPLDAARFVRQMLQQGFTSARDVGGGDETVAVRNAIDAGKIPGPRLWVSLEPLGPSGGHGDPRNGVDPGLSHPGWDLGIVNSPDQARLRVREHRGRGADLIKLMPSGGIASTGDDPRQQLMTNEEMRVAVETAHSLGMKVAAHIYPAGAIENAVRAGVDSVEHGSFATAKILRHEGRGRVSP